MAEEEGGFFSADASTKAKEDTCGTSHVAVEVLVVLPRSAYAYILWLVEEAAFGEEGTQ